MTDDRLERIAALALRKIGEAQGAIAASVAPPAPRVYTRLHRIASVLSSFRPEELRKLDPESHDFDALLSDSAPLEDASSPGRWALLPPARAAVLSRMEHAGEIHEAIEVGGRIAPPDDPLVRALALLTGPRGASLEQLEISSLLALSPVIPSLQRVVTNAPSRDDVERRLEFLRLLQPFERLVGEHFAGRDTELRQLSDYVGVLPPSSTGEALARFFFTTIKSPLLIWGVGGVGKSTLVAKFILTHAKLPEADRFPFAYLDFDRPALLASEPATILVEAVRQIGLQYPVAYQAAERLRTQWNELLLQSGGPRRTRGTKTSPGTVRVKQTTGSADSGTRERVLKDFVQFLSTLEVIRGPLLLVLDTFEEVQHRSDVYVRELIKFLEDLGRAVPRLRTVLSGRAAVPKISLDTTIELKDFDDEAAVGFLMQKEQGLTDPVIARTIVKQVGGNPLTLRLAAAVAAEEGVTKDGIRSLETHGAFGLIRVKKSHLQGQLFRRILDHIHDHDVVKIAHPGLVLRRVTPDLIQKVLAKPCGIEVPTKERAQDLFDKLQKEVALVSPAGLGVLEHRADVRRLMLGPLRETRPRETHEIDELAAGYYAEQPGVLPRAEEIYHRLVLGEPHEEIAALFLDGVEDYLGSALEELAAPEKAFLAERLGVELPPDAWAGATQQVWERTAIRKIEEALAVNNLEAALAVLGERRERSAQTMLRVREVIALTVANKFNDAASAAEAAIEAYASDGNLLGVFETQLAAAELSRRQGDNETALARLAGAEDIANATKNDVHIMRVLVARTQAMEGTTAAVQPSQQAIVECAARIGDETWRDIPLLLRAAAALSLDGHLMARALRLTGLPRLHMRQQETLRNYFELPFDEERLARMAEAPPPETARFILAMFADILRNDTGAETRLEEIPRVGELSVAVSDGELYEAVSTLGIDRDSLRKVLGSVDYSIDSLTFELDPESALRSVVDSARRNGWLATLMDALRKNARPNAAFLRFADRIGVGFSPKELRGDSLSRERLEALLDSRRSELATIESRICRVESRALVGTGFLVAPDLVLTSADTASEPSLSVRFDSGQTEGRIYAMGRSIRVLRVTPLLDTADPRPALLHLERPVAFEPVRGDAEGRPRGSFELRQPADAVVADQPILWIWYERDLCIGGSAHVIHADANQLGFPIRPSNAFRGAPCFDLDLQLVAVHCGAHRRLKRECIARPVGRIAAELLRMQVP